jgi:hypothetical protein
MNKLRVLSETLNLADKTLYAFQEGDVHLYRDNGSSGPVFPADWTRSPLSNIPERHDNKLLTRFKDMIAQMLIVRIDPHGMSEESRSEAMWPTHNFSNFASWYRQLAVEKPHSLGKLFKALEPVFADHFHELRLEKAGEARILRVVFEDEKGFENAYGLSELSDGQRILLVLYALLQFFSDAQWFLAIDEPGAHVALRELQPWIIELRDLVEERENCQAIIVSHHPEIVDYLAADAGIVFSRAPFSPVRAKPFEAQAGISPAELLARGWHDA